MDIAGSTSASQSMPILTENNKHRCLNMTGQSHWSTAYAKLRESTHDLHVIICRHGGKGAFCQKWRFGTGEIHAGPELCGETTKDKGAHPAAVQLRRFLVLDEADKLLDTNFRHDWYWAPVPIQKNSKACYVHFLMVLDIMLFYPKAKKCKDNPQNNSSSLVDPWQSSTWSNLVGLSRTEIDQAIENAVLSQNVIDLKYQSTTIW